MNWYRIIKTASDEDTLRNFYRYLNMTYKDLDTLYREVALWHHITEGSPRDEYIEELVDAFFGQFKTSFYLIDNLNEGALEWYFEETSYGPKKNIIRNFKHNLEETKSSISKAKNEIDKFKKGQYEFGGSKVISKAVRYLKEAQFNISLLRRALYHVFIIPHHYEDLVLVQEFGQLNLEGEPIYKEVSIFEKPPFGHGWKKKNEATDEWEWWKSDWDTSD